VPSETPPEGLSELSGSEARSSADTLVGGAVAAFAGDFCLRAFEGDDEG